MTNRYRYWTAKTAFCFERRCKCEGCSEVNFCEKKPLNNYYNLKPLKFAAIETFKNIGWYGFVEALHKIGEPKHKMKDVKIDEL